MTRELAKAPDGGGAQALSPRPWDSLTAAGGGWATVGACLEGEWGRHGIWKGRVKGREAQGWKCDSLGLASFQKTLCNQPEKHI